MALRNEPAAVPVVLQFAMYPATDATTTADSAYPSASQFADGYGLESASMRWYREAYAADPTHWRTAPVHHDQTGMPPTLIVTASLDPLRDSGRRYAAKCAEAGVRTTYVEMEGTIHGFAGYRRLIPSANDDFARAIALAKAMLAETA
jgi:acetyl esterase